MRPSKPLLKINFRLRLQIHTPFYQSNIRNTLGFSTTRSSPSQCLYHSHLTSRFFISVQIFCIFFLQKNLVSSYSQGWPPWISLLYSSMHFSFLSLFFPYATEMFSHFFHFTRRLTNFFFVYFYMNSSCFSHFALFPRCSMSFQQRGTGWIFSSPNRLFLDINNESWVDDETSQSMERSRPMKIFKWS